MERSRFKDSAPLLGGQEFEMDVKEVSVTEKQTQGSSSQASSSRHQGQHQIDPDLDLDTYHGGLLKGWRAGLYYSAFLVFLVLIVNIGFTIWIATHRGWSNVQSGLVTEGKCSDVRRSNTVIHFFTNLLSTIMLAASNYTMQFLTAPTRKAVDKAHARGQALRVGVLSMSNLRWVGKRRVFFWALLAVSSLPLHLFFNSAFYYVVAANNYTVFPVADYFLDPAWQNRLGNGFEPYATSLMATSPNAAQQLRALSELQARAQSGRLQRLSNFDCVKQYSQDYLQNRTHVLLVATRNSTATLDARHGSPGLVYNSRTLSNAALFDRGCNIDPFPWVCPPAPAGEECPLPCKYRLDDVFENINFWEAEGVQVDHCLSMVEEAQCELRFSRPATVAVTSVNIIKIAVILAVALGPIKAPMATVGDAISSFLSVPDPTTFRRCLAVENDFKPSPNGGFEQTPARQFSYYRERWYRSASTSRWLGFFAVFGTCLFLCFFLLGFGIPKVVGKTDSASLMKLGMGAIHFETLISSVTPSHGVNGLISNVLVANTPQVVVSIFYFAVNNLLTCMQAGREWSEFAHHRKGLRVSDKSRGAQRTTYFLSLPYRYALPLMAGSTIVHWLVSQSLFLVVLKTYCDDWSYCPATPYYGYDTVTGVAFGMCWSPLAVMLTIIVGSLMGLYVILLGFRKYRPGLPLAAGSTAVISAACHPHYAESHDPKVAAGYLKWGVVARESDGLKARRVTSQSMAYGGEEIDHCTFTAGSAELPEKGVLCA